MTKPTHSSRTSTLLIASLSLASNALSSLFVHQLPDDPLRLAAHYGAYLHFANVLSIFGVIGAWRKNPHSIHLFSTYLLLDTLLSALPRLLLLTLLAQSSPALLCAAPGPSSSSFHTAGFADYVARDGAGAPGFESVVAAAAASSSRQWSEVACRRVVALGCVTLVGGVLAAMGLQVLGALCVRDYARGLFEGEREGEGGAVGVEIDVERVGEGDEKRVLEGGFERGRGRGRGRESCGSMPPIWEEGDEF